MLAFDDDEEGKRPKVEVYGTKTDKVETKLPLTTGETNGIDLRKILATIQSQVPVSVLNSHPDYDAGALHVLRRYYLGGDGNEMAGFDVTIRLSSLDADCKWEQSYQMRNDLEMLSSSAIYLHHTK